MSWKAVRKDDILSFSNQEMNINLDDWNCNLQMREVDVKNIKSIGLEISDEASGNQSVAMSSKGNIAVSVSIEANDKLAVKSSIKNAGANDIVLEKIVFSVRQAVLGNSGNQLSFFKNGYQSWTATRTYRPHEKEVIPIVGFAKNMQDNLHNIPSGKTGEFTSEMFSVIGNLDRNIYMMPCQGREFDQFFYIWANFNYKTSNILSLQFVLDFGSQVLPSGKEISSDEFFILTSDNANHIQESYFDMIKNEAIANEKQPVGWCSWYYYFTKVSQRDMLENLKSAEEHKVSWEFFQLDDGYQTRMGDWLSLNDKFSDGMKPLVDKIKNAGMKAGIWLAPFTARSNSSLYKEHYEWVLRDERGKPCLAGWNPNWGIGGNFYGLDTTHPGFQEYLRTVFHTIVHEWGFEYLKLDFVYGACLYGKAYDQTLSPAQRLKLGYKIVREVAGDDIFILGCGAPLSASLGYVNGNRIGPDVAPYWFATFRYYLSRDPHALCAKVAIRSTINRAQMHRKLWVNDPDCLLIRETDTKLTHDERISLANAIIITGGMLLLSDDLTKLDEKIWKNISVVENHIRNCYDGDIYPLDYMEKEIAELVYNTNGYLAVFNFLDNPVSKKVDYKKYLSGFFSESAKLESVWDKQSFQIKDGAIDFGNMKAHSSLLLRVMK